ncbi:MAG: hypothetical protein V7761_06555 [Amylibacter sp.]
MASWNTWVSSDLDGHCFRVSARRDNPRGQPLTYWTDTPILLSAQGGDFVSGTIRIAIHAMILTPPAAV